MLEFIVNSIVVPYLVGVVFSVGRRAFGPKTPTTTTDGPRVALPCAWPLGPEELLQLACSEPLPTTSDQDLEVLVEPPAMDAGWTVAASAPLVKPAPQPVVRPGPQVQPTPPVAPVAAATEPQELDSWAITPDEDDVSSEGSTKTLTRVNNESGASAPKCPAVAEAIKNGLQNVLNKRAARGAGGVVAGPADGFKLRTRDLRSLPKHLDPRFRGSKQYVSTAEPRPRAPSDVPAAVFFKPKPENPVDAWVGGQLDQTVELYVDPDCRVSTPGTVAAGLSDTDSLFRVPLSQFGDDAFDEEEEEERHLRLKELAAKAVDLEARLEEELKRRRGDPPHVSGQPSDQESGQNQNRRRGQIRNLPIALSPSLVHQIPGNLLGRAVLRRDENVAPNATPAEGRPTSDFDKKVALLQRVLDKDAATLGALTGMDISQLVRGVETGDWTYLSGSQGPALLATMIQVVTKEQQDASDLAKAFSRATLKVITSNKKPDAEVEAEKDMMKNVLDNKFDEFWNTIRSNISFDKDPLALSGRRQYASFFPAAGQMPPQPSRHHIKMEFPQIRDELEMILREIRRYSKQFFSSPGFEELPPELLDVLLNMCDGSRDVLMTLLKHQDTKYLVVAAFIKRVLFNICLGTGWIWQGYDDNLSGLFTLERNLYNDPRYKYQRTVALTWRAHRFTQLTYQPWWDHMLELRIKLVADEMYKLLRPLQGEDRAKTDFPQVRAFMDLLELVEYFSKLSAKMYEHEALWSYHFPSVGREFEPSTMVWDDPLRNHGVAIRGSD
ncbi:hypothetical protein TWF481_000169 [Arthrobotrys musiformis]|uniref:Uncharacterized protein n=1 Tax=Arthrobotrys musiformis TaxID=47236 RepID=A0AAV9WLU6_9PEZI